MSIEILDCLKRQRDICIKNIIPSQNTAFRFTPALTGILYDPFEIIIRRKLGLFEAESRADRPGTLAVIFCQARGIELKTSWRIFGVDVRLQ